MLGYVKIFGSPSPILPQFHILNYCTVCTVTHVINNPSADNIPYPQGSDWAGGTPGDSRWAGGHQKYYINKLIFLQKRSILMWKNETKFPGRFGISRIFYTSKAQTLQEVASVQWNYEKRGISGISLRACLKTVTVTRWNSFVNCNNLMSFKGYV